MCASFGQVFIKLWMRYSNRKHPSLFSTGRVVPLLPVMVCQKSTLKAANSEVIIMTTTLILHIKRLKTTPGLGTLLHGQKKHRSPRHGHLHQRSDAPQTQAKTGKDRQRYAKTCKDMQRQAKTGKEDHEIGLSPFKDPEPSVA